MNRSVDDAFRRNWEIGAIVSLMVPLCLCSIGFGYRLYLDQELKLALTNMDPHRALGLLRQGANVNIKSKRVRKGHHGSSPSTVLELAIRARDPQLAREALVRGADPNVRFPNGGTLLWLSGWYGQWHTTLAMLHHGANPNEGSERVTPLMLAVVNDRPEVVRALLEKGADPTCKWTDGRSATRLTDRIDMKAMLDRAADRWKQAKITE